MVRVPEADLATLAEALGALGSGQERVQSDVVPSVLIVDDQQDATDVMQRMLAAQGYQVRVADGGQAALTAVAEAAPDLMLLDLVMPDMSGMDVIEQVKAGPYDTRIIVVSGAPRFEFVQQALTHGAADFLRKPLERQVLLSTLEREYRNLQLERRVRAAEQRLAQSERLYRFMVDHAPDLVCLLDSNGCFSFANDRFESVLGFSSADLIGQSILALVRHEDQDLLRAVLESHVGARGARTTEVRLRSRQGSTAAQNRFERWFEVTTTGIFREPDASQGEAGDDLTQSQPDSGLLAVYVTARDVTERKRVENLVRHQAYHDLLTHLPNRALFHDRLEQAISQAERNGHRLAVMFLDLDGFKTVNDTFGHPVGDRLLKLISDRLRNDIRRSDTFARFGGDEFCVLLPRIQHRDDAAAVAQKLIDSLQRPFAVDGHQLMVGASIGIAVYPDAGESVDALIQSADIAMYQTKAFGKNGYQFFAEGMSARFTSLLERERELRQALANGDIEPLYQPLVDMATGTIVGVEALARWRHAEHGLVEPLDFMPLAEETGLVVQVDRSIQWQACHAVAEWQRAGHGELTLALNVSAAQLEQSQFADEMMALLETSGIDPATVKLEITEGVLMRDLDVLVPKLERLAVAGVRVGVEDFGVGQSALGYLQRCPVEAMKIDRSFISEIQPGADGSSIITAIIQVARGLGLQVIAEGVENPAQHAWLTARGCGRGQGFLYSRPLSQPELTRTLERGTGLPTDSGTAS